MTRRRRIFHVDEAESAILAYNETAKIALTKDEFNAQVQTMRQGLRELDAKKKAEDNQG